MSDSVNLDFVQEAAFNRVPCNEQSRMRKFVENYSLNVCNGYIVTQNMFEQYSMKSQSNDIVRMELNMRLCTLSYYINGQFQGIAYDEVEKNEGVCYQLAVSLEGDQDGITLLDFKVVSK